MALEPMVLALGVAASLLSRVYDCTLEAAQHQSLQKTSTVVTQTMYDRPGEVVGAFSADYRAAALIEPADGRIRGFLGCTPLGGDRVVVCTDKGERTALVMFQDGRLRISVRADDPEQWVSIAGQCTLRAAAPAPESGGADMPPVTPPVSPLSPGQSNHARPL